jgi:hypothetical protein
MYGKFKIYILNHALIRLTLMDRNMNMDRNYRMNNYYDFHSIWDVGITFNIFPRYTRQEFARKISIQLCLMEVSM